MSIAPEHLSRVYFVFFDIKNNPLRVAGAGWPLYWQGELWQGVGDLGTISGLGENVEMAAAQITLGLDGVPPEYVREIRTLDYQERPVYIWQNDLSPNLQVTASQLVWAGRMDTVDIQVGSVSRLQMRCESALARWNRPTPRRMNHVQQQLLYPADNGLQYVAACANVRLEL